MERTTSIRYFKLQLNCVYGLRQRVLQSVPKHSSLSFQPFLTSAPVQHLEKKKKKKRSDIKIYHEEGGIVVITISS